MDVTFLFGITALTLDQGGIVMGDLRNSFVDILRPFRHDDQCLLLVALVQHMEYLRGGILKNNGIQRLVPAKQCSGDP